MSECASQSHPIKTRSMCTFRSPVGKMYEHILPIPKINIGQ